MDDPRETSNNSPDSKESQSVSGTSVDDADAAIAWYLSDEFEEHVGRCFEEGKREALDARERFLKARQESSARETQS